jgi:hypothetical protein
VSEFSELYFFLTQDGIFKIFIVPVNIDIGLLDRNGLLSPVWNIWSNRPIPISTGVEHQKVTQKTLDDHQIQIQEWLEKLHRIVKFLHTLTFSMASFFDNFSNFFLIKHFQMIILWMLGLDWCSFWLQKIFWLQSNKTFSIKFSRFSHLGWMLLCARKAWNRRKKW